MKLRAREPQMSISMQNPSLESHGLLRTQHSATAKQGDPPAKKTCGEQAYRSRLRDCLNEIRAAASG